MLDAIALTNIPRRLRRAPLRLAAALFGAILLAIAGGFHRAQARDFAPPNILIILVDDLGYADLGYTGAADVHTPNIDRLARDGIAFPNGYSPSPVCSPSRAGLLTGRHPARFGLDVNIPYAPTDESVGLPLTETLLPEYLRQAGYRTGIVGKWHLGAAAPFHPLRRGFDSHYGSLRDYADYYNVNTALNANALPTIPPAERSRDASGLGKHLTTRLTAGAISFATESGEPFFLYLAYHAAHTPHLPAAKTARKYAHIQDKQRRDYLARVDELDFNIGWLVNSLKESGQWRNTMVFFLSDNGGDARYASNLPLRSGKRSLYEGGIRVPFAASWPVGWPQGATYEPPVSSLDIAATALAASGGAIDPAQPLDGVNLDPFIRGAPGNPHDALFWRAQRPDDPSLYRFAVRGGGETAFKLIKEAFSGITELFNLGGDPDESRDLADNRPDKAAELAGLWDAWNAHNAADSVIPSKSPSPPPDSFVLAHAEKAALADAIADFQPGDYGYPAAQSRYDVYLDGNSLLYIKQACAPEDTYERFYLHIFPQDAANLPADRKELGFVGYNFRFSAAGVALNGDCIVKAPLPYYRIARIRTGQYSGANQLWRADFAPP